eukprot:15118341-Alexandrium_andersonii.AAC.1
MGPVSLESGCPDVQQFPNSSRRRRRGVGTIGGDPPLTPPRADTSRVRVDRPRGISYARAPQAFATRCARSERH